nr:WSD1 family O-acyltransferase [Actinomycetota bacterium]
VQQAVAHAAASPRAYNLVISNIPGPREPLYMRGCRLEAAHPVIPLSDGHALSIGLTTVGERACFGLYADRRALPDADLVARRVDLAIDELLGLVA